MLSVLNRKFCLSLKKTLMQKSKAFSVVEVSVVVVIASLLVFTAFKGIGIVKKSKINNLVKQIKEIENGTKAFYNFNGALPGDTTQDVMIDFSNQSKTVDIKTGFPTNRGDGDGLIEFGYGSDKKADGTSQDCNANPSNYANEATLAMYQLYAGNYISSNGIVSSNKSLYTIRNTDVDQVESAMAATKIKDLYISFFGISNKTTSTYFPTKQSAGLSYNGNTLMIGGIYKTKASFASNQGLYSDNPGRFSLISAPITYDPAFPDRAGCAPSVTPYANVNLTDVTTGCDLTCQYSMENGNCRNWNNTDYATPQYNSTCHSVNYYYPVDQVLKGEEADAIDRVIDDGNPSSGILRSFTCSYDNGFSGGGSVGTHYQNGLDVFVDPVCSAANSSKNETPRIVLYMLNNI